MRRPRLLPVLLGATAACTSAPGPPVRLGGTFSDTIIVNSRWPQSLPVHAFDAKGRAVQGAQIRFERIDGPDLPVTSSGDVTCTSSGDLQVEAILDSLSTRVLVRCRFVREVRLNGPIQFVLGDSVLGQPRSFRIGVYGADGRPESLYTVSSSITDPYIATVRGTTIYPRSRGPTTVDVHVGDQDGTTGVHVYQRVDGLAALDTLLRVHPLLRAFAVPLRMESGTHYRQRLPPGGWMLSLFPREQDDPNPISVFVDGANCESNFLNDPGRLACGAGSNTSVVVYRPPSKESLPPATTYLLVRTLFGKGGRLIPGVPATPEALPCVKQLLSGRGYNLRRESSEDHLLQMNRRGEVGTEARREWIEVKFVTNASEPLLRGKVWSVDSYPIVPPRYHKASPESIEDAADATLRDARDVMRQCGRD